MLLACVLSSLLLPHGGQYLPPLGEPDAPREVLTLPGSGPTLQFEADRWEWWFDFHQEELLDLRARLASLPDEPDGPAWRPSTASDRVEIALPVLQDAAERSQRDLRATAALALGRLSEPAGLPALLELAEDHDLFVRAQAILGLGVSAARQRAAADAHAAELRAAGGSVAELKSGVPLAVLNRLDGYLELRRQPAELFTYAAAALGLLGGPEARSLLAPYLRPKVLEDLPQQQRAAVIHAAGLFGDAQLDAQLLALRKRWIWTHDGDVRALVAVALGRSGRPENLPALLELLGDDDNQVRRSAASALNGMAPLEPGAGLERVLELHARQKDVPTRLHLLRVLGRARQPVARERLLSVLARRSAGLERPYAALALGLDGHADVVPALLAELDDTSERSLRGALAMALGLAGDPRAAAPLLALLQDEGEPAAQAWLALALGLLGSHDPSAVVFTEKQHAALFQRLDELFARSHDPETLRLVCLSFALLGDSARVRTLLEELPATRSTVDRAALIFAAGQLGDRRCLPALRDLAADDEQPTFLRRYALGALGQVCEPAARDFSVRLSRLAEPHHQVGFLFELTRVY